MLGAFIARWSAFLCALGRLRRRAARNREAQVVAAFSVATLVGSLGANRLLTEFVDPDVLGEFYLLLNLSSWLALPAASGYVYVSRHWAVAREAGAAHRFAGGIVRAALVLVCIAALGTLVLGTIPHFRLSLTVGLLVFLVAAAQSVHQAFEPVPAAERRRVLAGILTMFASPLRPVLVAIGFALLATKTATTLLALHTAGTVMLGIAAVVAFGVVLRQAPDGTRDLPRQISVSSFLSYAGPYFGGVLAMQVCATAERWGLAQRGDESATAVFVQAVGLGGAAVAAFTSVLTAYYLPVISHAAGANHKPIAAASAPLRRYVALSSTILAGLVIIGIPLAPIATTLFFGGRFAAVEDLLPLTITAGALFAFGQVLTAFAVCARETVSPNASYIVSRVVYAGLLIFAGTSASARTFSMYLVLSNLLYVLLVAASAIWLTIREQRGSARDAMTSAP